MKNLKIILILLLFTQLNFAQQTYKITEGELQFINPEKGIILKKNNDYLRLTIQSDINNNKMKFSTIINKISDADFINYSHNIKNVYYNDIIINYDFKKVKKRKFVSVEKDEFGEYELTQFNKETFVIYQYEFKDDTNKMELIECDEYSKYFYANFGENKKIIITSGVFNSFIIPTKNKLQLLGNNRFENYKIVKQCNLTNKHIWLTTNRIFDEQEFIIDTLKNKKVQLKNIYNEILIKEIYDSITINSIIYCYKKNNVDLYNLRFKKLNKKSIKTAHTYMGNVQILKKNNLNWIDWNGKVLKKPSFFHSYSLPEAIMEVEQSVIKINKKYNSFFLVDSNFYNYDTQIFKKDSIQLINTKNIEFFLSVENSSFNKIISKNINNYEDKENLYGQYNKYNNGLLYSKFDIVAYKNINGTFGFNFIDKFINPNFSNKDFDLLQELQSIEFQNPFYKLEKNNLFMLYPLQNNFKYKSLSIFQYNFARFELPNGQKGWLSKEGKEYLDE